MIFTIFQIILVLAGGVSVIFGSMTAYVQYKNNKLEFDPIGVMIMVIAAFFIVTMDLPLLIIAWGLVMLLEVVKLGLWGIQ